MNIKPFQEEWMSAYEGGAKYSAWQLHFEALGVGLLVKQKRSSITIALSEAGAYIAPPMTLAEMNPQMAARMPDVFCSFNNHIL
ncbi:hypothetical protein [Lacrimispora sp.]|uniref:hypothetical protein n=1 Tax=Lacrimispora sp. TaxID=2719234 RepID=UPI0028AFF842|nr:hypothetical protein [Lacrimispora sp.]